MKLLWHGVIDLAAKAGVSAVVKSIVGVNVTWTRQKTGRCSSTSVQPDACAYMTTVEFYESFFTANNTDSYVKGLVVHELAHVIHYGVCVTNWTLFAEVSWRSLVDYITHPLTSYANENFMEYWAEAMADWVYGHTGPGGYMVGESFSWVDPSGKWVNVQQSRITNEMKAVIEKVFRGKP